MEKNQVYQFTQKYISEFGNPNYTPYGDFEEKFTSGLHDLGFDVSYKRFLKNHPEFEKQHYSRNDAAWQKAFSSENDLQALGDFVLYMARDDARGCWSLADIEHQWYIAPLKRMAELCK